jgi:hypothetical protein
MAPSSTSTPPCASCCGVAWVGIRSLARPSPTPKRPRQPASAYLAENVLIPGRLLKVEEIRALDDVVTVEDEDGTSHALGGHCRVRS